MEISKLFLDSPIEALQLRRQIKKLFGSLRGMTSSTPSKGKTGIHISKSDDVSPRAVDETDNGIK